MARLTKQQRERLEQALSRLPKSLAMFRNPILGLALQDQELLSAGEADTDALAQTIAQAKADTTDESLEIAEDLEAWISRQPRNNSAWAGPIWFAIGFLRGDFLFNDGETDGTALPPPPPPGLQHIDIDIPRGMKKKLHCGAVELSNREVKVFILELDDVAYEVRWGNYRGYNENSLTHAQTPPHIRWELDKSFRVGALTGIRIRMFHKESGLLLMAGYGFELARAKLEITFISRSQAGGPLESYETFLATIREKA